MSACGGGGGVGASGSTSSVTTSLTPSNPVSSRAQASSLAVASSVVGASSIASSSNAAVNSSNATASSLSSQATTANSSVKSSVGSTASNSSAVTVSSIVNSSTSSTTVTASSIKSSSSSPSSVAAVVASIEIAPGAVSPAVGGSQQLVAVGKAGNGSLVNLYGKVTWRISSGSGVASVTSSGLLKRLTAGNAEVEASALGKVATLKITSDVQNLVLGYDNTTSKWAKVYIYVWTGESTEIAPWPGVELTNNNGIWAYTVEASKLVNGKVNVVFNSGTGDKTGDLKDVAASGTYSGTQWTTTTAGSTSAQVSVIYGIVQGGGSTFTSGTVLTINANAPTDNFQKWEGASEAYIFTDPTKPSAQMVVPSGVPSMTVQAQYNTVVDPYKAARSLYAAQCSGCHGINGANAINGGDLNGLHASNDYTLAQLATKISTTMPYRAVPAALCSGTTPGTCGYDIAKMIMDNKWIAADTCTGAACTAGASLDSRNLRLLTTEEFLNSARDIFGVNFDANVVAGAVGDGTVRNFNTASSLALNDDRVIGYQGAALEIAKQTIAAKTFTSLVSGCGTDKTCAVKALGKKVFRRPLTDAEATRYVGLYTDADAGKAVIQAMLISPNFMYRSEMGVLESSGLYRLTNYEIATLLSYSLWASTPDDALLNAAGSTLDIKAQVTRMLSDVKAERGLRRFAQGWLLNGKYGYNAISTPSLASSFNEETIRFAMETIKADLPYKELLTANYTYANAELAQYYGNASVASGWAKSAFKDSDPRNATGLLGHGSFLASRVSSVENPSPIQRGLFVRDVLMCQELPPPQKAGLSIPKGPEDTNRTANAKHTADAACQGCHQYIDGIGFGFEKFGSNAKFRETETLTTGVQKAINAAGAIKSLDSAETKLDPDSLEVDYQTVPQLATLIANSGQGSACYSRQFYRYITGRNEEVADEKIIPAYSAKVRAGGGMKEMIVELAVNPSFILRRK